MLPFLPCETANFQGGGGGDFLLGNSRLWQKRVQVREEQVPLSSSRHSSQGGRKHAKVGAHVFTVP